MPDQLLVELQRGPHNIIIAAPWDKHGELGQRITVVEIRLLLRHEVELLNNK